MCYNRPIATLLIVYRYKSFHKSFQQKRAKIRERISLIALTDIVCRQLLYARKTREKPALIPLKVYPLHILIVN